MYKCHPLRLISLSLILVVVMGPLSVAQTTGIPLVNDLFVDIGATGVPGGPPGGAPCTFVPPLPLPPATPFMISLTTPAPLLGAVIMVDIVPCAPAFTCLPPVFGPYAAIPPAMFCPVSPTGLVTNQSVDMLFTPTSGALVGGITAPIPGTPGGMLSSPVFISPPFPIGIIVTCQAVFFDMAGGSPFFGMVVSNAIEILL